MSCQFYTDTLDEPKCRAMLAAIASSLPNAAVAYRIGLSGSIHAVDDPGAWCAAHLGKEVPAVICNGDEAELITLMAFAIEPSFVASHTPLMQVIVDIPWIRGYVEHVPAFAAAFGPAAKAYWGIASTSDTGAALAEGVGRTSSERGLPQAPSPSVFIPGRLGWVSYWSSETCRQLGFSAKDARASLFARVIAVEGHGLVLQLTEDVLDLGRPEHLFAVERAYKAFPDIDRKWGL